MTASIQSMQRELPALEVKAAVGYAFLSTVYLSQTLVANRERRGE